MRGTKLNDALHAELVVAANHEPWDEAYKERVLIALLDARGAVIWREDVGAVDLGGNPVNLEDDAERQLAGEAPHPLTMIEYFGLDDRLVEEDL